jgi:regulator of protease activity HflC (stomatin/prohibitin superfamily)
MARRKLRRKVVSATPDIAIIGFDGDARLSSDVQLAARRSLATMNLEEILTNRNRLSEDILADVKEAASSYGVAIARADVKDLIFPGNLQEIMNRVLASELMSKDQRT